MTTSRAAATAGTSVLETERLLLRAWRDEDRQPYAAINGDPIVMEHFPSTLDAAASNAHVDRVVAQWESRGFSHWAVEVRGGAPFIGWVGLTEPGWLLPFSPCVEIGWRLAKEHWGHGYAPEAAAAALRFGFEQLGLDEIVSFTTTTNAKSERVMQKLGMVRDLDGDFDHPVIADGSHLQRHVLYRMSRARWQEKQPAPPLASGQQLGSGNAPR